MRINFLQTKLIACVLFVTSNSCAQDIGFGMTIERAVGYHSNILITRIISGQVVYAANGSECGVLFIGTNKQQLKGTVDSSQIKFLTNGRFSVGSEYVVFLSDRPPFSSSLIRSVVSTEGKQIARQCRDKLSEFGFVFTTRSKTIALMATASTLGGSLEWLQYDPLRLLLPAPKFNARSEIIRKCIDDEDECPVIRRRELVSMMSFIAGIEKISTPGGSLGSE